MCVAHHQTASNYIVLRPIEFCQGAVTTAILGSTIEFKYERASNVVAITAQHSAQLKPTDTERWLREPLRIMLGQPVEPRLSARNIGGKAIIFILAPPRLDIVSWSAFWTDDSSSNPDS